MIDRESGAREQDELIEALETGGSHPRIGDAERSMLDYARKLTDAPGGIDAADIRTLRDSGFDDRGIHDICSIAAYFAFVNRIADGLGVDLESERRGR